MKKLIFAILLLSACGQVNPETYQPIGGVYGRSDGWYIDSSGNWQQIVNGAATGAYFTSGGNFVTTGSVSYTDLTVTGTASVGSTLAVTGAATLSSTLGVTSQTIGIPFDNFRIYDNIDAILDQAAADDDDLTLIQGTFGTNATTIETIDCGGLADTTQYGAFWFAMPSTYIAGSTVALKANVGMVTTVADQAATLDFQCYVPDYANEDATVSTDLITTAAQSVNSTTFADKSFTLDDDAAGYELDAGTIVQCRMIALCDDDGDAAGGITIRVNRLDVIISS
jgi:hypothetical protein